MAKAMQGVSVLLEPITCSFGDQSVFTPTQFSEINRDVGIYG